MKNAFLIAGTAAIFLLAAYGAFRLFTAGMTPAGGRAAAETVHPFVDGMADVAREKLEATPNEQLEKEAEVWSNKLYPIVKGALRGQIEAASKDPNREEFAKLMYEAGKSFSENFVKPFAAGAAEGAAPLLGGQSSPDGSASDARSRENLNRAMEGLRRFGRENKDLVQIFTGAVDELRKKLQEIGPPLPPGPGFAPQTERPAFDPRYLNPNQRGSGYAPSEGPPPYATDGNESHSPPRGSIPPRPEERYGPLDTRR